MTNETFWERQLDYLREEKGFTSIDILNYLIGKRNYKEDNYENMCDH